MILNELSQQFPCHFHFSQRSIEENDETLSNLKRAKTNNENSTQESGVVSSQPTIENSTQESGVVSSQPTIKNSTQESGVVSSQPTIENSTQESGAAFTQYSVRTPTKYVIGSSCYMFLIKTLVVQIGLPFLTKISMMTLENG